MILQIIVVLILCGGLFSFVVWGCLAMAKMARDSADTWIDKGFVVLFYLFALGGAFVAVWLAYVCIGKILGYIPPDA